jgi:hypothetical protein
VPQRDVLEPDERVRADDAGEAADALGDDRVSLVRHGRGAFLVVPERLLDLAHLGAGEVADLGREPLERRGRESQRGEQLCVAVALQHLGRGGRRLEPEPFAGEALELRARRRIGPHGSGELAHAKPLDRPRDPLAVAVEREGPAGELEPERRRLGVHAVRATDHERVAVLLGACRDGAEGTVEALEHERARLLHGQGERRVEHVGRRQAVVEPATFAPDRLGDRVHERGYIVVRRSLELRDPRDGRRARFHA